MRRILVNDMLSALPDHRTFWNDLQEWFGMEFVGVPFNQVFGREAMLPPCWDEQEREVIPSLIIRNASYMPPFSTRTLGGGDISAVPTISLLQDIFTEGEGRLMQEAVIRSSTAVVFNSYFTRAKYGTQFDSCTDRVIPLPVDFTVFEPGNPMGLQQALSLPDGCVLWVGASQQAAGVKGFDLFIRIVRANPDIPFVGVFKDALPEYAPPNLRMYCRLTHEELARVMGACRVGLCTSRMESQHLAGIEMGACGLPLVAPEVGTYWKRHSVPGTLVSDSAVSGNAVGFFSQAIREVMNKTWTRSKVREYWREEFDPSVVRAAWTKVIEEVEHGAD